MNKAAEILKTARKLKHLTQEELAQSLGVDMKTIQRYEKGQFPLFKDKNIEKLDDILGTNLTDIIYDKSNSQRMVREDNPRLVVNNAPGALIASLLRIEAKLNVLISAEAERTASETNQKATDVLRELNGNVRAEEEGLRAVLRPGEEGI